MRKEEALKGIQPFDYDNGTQEYVYLEKDMMDVMDKLCTRIAQLETENQYLKDLLQVSVDSLNEISAKLGLSPMTLNVDDIK